MTRPPHDPSHALAHALQLAAQIPLYVVARDKLPIPAGRNRMMRATWKLATIGVVFAFALLQGLWLSRRAEAVEAAK